jgi:TDG/mug DNA glycosylase family protein
MKRTSGARMPRVPRGAGVPAVRGIGEAVKPVDWSRLRLRDRIEPRVRVLFVGINPGVRSAITGHHFAGPSNRFWRLLFESGLVPRALTFEEDVRLPEFGFGITNLVARPSPGIDDLTPAEYRAGWRVLEGKIEAYRPGIVALVGVTLYRAIRPLLEDTAGGRPVVPRSKAGPITLGFQPPAVHDARFFVLPNPSGRNANFSYAEMLAAFKSLKSALEP